MRVLPGTVFVTDTSVLVNFLRIGRADLLGALSCRFVVTDHAAGEISEFYPEQLERYQAALANACIESHAVTDTEALRIFADLTSTGRLGVGECATIAHAIVSGAAVAIDDRQAIKAARRIAHHLAIVGTVDIMKQMILEDLLTIAEADAIKAEWETRHRFRILAASFAELVRG